MPNTKTTGDKAATAASKTLQSKSTGANSKTAAGTRGLGGHRERWYRAPRLPESTDCWRSSARQRGRTALDRARRARD